MHFFDPKTTKIIEIVREDVRSGIIEAKIEAYNKPKNKWIKKDRSTTFFPRQWNLEQLFHECDFAFENKVKIEDKTNVYQSITISGIKVKIIIDGDIVRSIYPILDENS